MERIKSYEMYILESSDNSNLVVEMFSNLTRNYETNKAFYTDQLQFKVSEERRDWGDIRQKAKLDETNEDDAFYKLVYVLDDKDYLLEINFIIKYVGKKEKDAPETATTENLERLNTILNGLSIKKIKFKGPEIDYNSDSLSASVKLACTKFLVKTLAKDYDTLDNSLTTLEQQ